ncbi:MAG: hypothetical protein SGCHY_002259 [Lobulomycetales sp.]
MLSPLTIPVSVTAAAKEPRSFGLFVTSPIDIAAGDNAISLPSPGGTFLSTNSPGARMPFADSPSKALERDFCSQQFLCCGFVFKGLHDLLEHYDVSHPDRRPVAPVSAHSMLSSAFRSVGSDAQPYAPMTDICRRAIVDHLDPEMDISGAAASSDNDSTAPPQGAGLKRRPNKDLACKRKRKKGASSVNADFMSESNTDTDIDILTVDEEDFVRKVDGLSLLLPPTPPITPSLGFSSGPGPAKSKKKSVSVDPAAASTPKPKKLRQSSLSTVDPETGERKFICAVPDCKKQYKNANGLKYHLLHAHSDGEGVPEEYRLFQKKREDEGHRPYVCSVENCSKTYKNLNGLKYHIEHFHSALLPAKSASEKQGKNSLKKGSAQTKASSSLQAQQQQGPPPIVSPTPIPFQQHSPHLHPVNPLTLLSDAVFSTFPPPPGAQTGHTRPT